MLIADIERGLHAELLMRHWLSSIVMEECTSSVEMRRNASLKYIWFYKCVSCNAGNSFCGYGTSIKSPPTSFISCQLYFQKHIQFHYVRWLKVDDSLTLIKTVGKAAKMEKKENKETPIYFTFMFYFSCFLTGPFNIGLLTLNCTLFLSLIPLETFLR